MPDKPRPATGRQLDRLTGNDVGFTCCGTSEHLAGACGAIDASRILSANGPARGERDA